jgi:hypothetical protein
LKTSLGTYITEPKPSTLKSGMDNQLNNTQTGKLQEVPQIPVPEASLETIAISDEKDKFIEGSRGSLIDLETFQKMRLNNLSNRSAHWDPKVFRKIAQLIDPPKSPTETPVGSSNSTRPSSPDAKNLASRFTLFSKKIGKVVDFVGEMVELTHIFDHLPALQSLSSDSNVLQGKFVSLLA